MSVLNQVIDNLKDYVDDIYQGPTVEYMVFKNRDHFKDDCYKKWAAEECLNYICNQKIDISTVSNIRNDLNESFTCFMFRMLSLYYETEKYMFYIAYTVAKDMHFITMDFFKSYI